MPWRSWLGEVGPPVRCSGFLAFGACDGRQRTIAFSVYGAQLVLNIVLFLPISRVAGLLLVPYALWVTFASALNFSIWRLNA